MLKIFLIVLVAVFSLGYAYLFLEIQSLKTSRPEALDFADIAWPQNTNQIIDYSEFIKSQIEAGLKQATSSGSPKPSATATPVAINQSVVSGKNQVTYIPLSGSFSTNSTSWVDVAGTEAWIDLENEYGKGAVVTFEATLKIANASGLAFARLYDATNKIAVDGSEVNVSTAGYSTVSSTNLPLWRGRNLYKVQIKSLNSQEATFGGGRIKISY